MNQYNVWNKWGKLKTVVLGNNYSSNFFKDIKNKRICSALQRIADETQEDLDYYESVLKDFGCNVLRPKLDPNEGILDHVISGGEIRAIPKAPLQPRDNQLVIGNCLYYTGLDHFSIHQCLNMYNKNNTVHWNRLIGIEQHRQFRHWDQDHWNKLAGSDWGSFNDYKNNPKYFDKLPKNILIEVLEHHQYANNFNKFHTVVQAPEITVVGRDLYIDEHTAKFYKYQEEALVNNISNIRINKLNIGGHNDGCFHTVKPGAIISLHDIQTYENTFPDWDVCYLPNQSWNKVKGFTKLKKQVGGKWWVPGEEENDEFTHFVETWLQDWVGYVEETVFDVNVLVLDEHHVCVNNMNPTVIEFLKKHHMEPVHIPWRHRYFWDGGLHCITLDLEREGLQEDYFPDRGNAGVIDHGFD